MKRPNRGKIKDQTPKLKEVSEEEFYNFIKQYPRQLYRHGITICDPPSIYYIDPTLGEYPVSQVATHWYDWWVKPYPEPHKVVQMDGYTRIECGWKILDDTKA